MNTDLNKQRMSVSAGLCAFALLVPSLVGAQETKGIPARLTAGDETRNVYLVGREDDMVRFKTDPESEAVAGLPVDRLSDISVRLEYDGAKVYSAARQGEWGDAIRILLPAVRPHLPYLDIPGHEAAPLALQTGVYFLHAGMRVSGLALAPAPRAKAKKYFVVARRLFRACAKADWWPNAEDADYRALLCSVLLEEATEVEEGFAFAGAPPPDGPGVGAYWLAVAYRDFLRGEFLDAADAAARSAVFEDKDLSTFPYATALGGVCNERIERWYRARDAFFEVARLFPALPPGPVAEQRLVSVIQSGAVQEAEQAATRSVFFQGTDDIRRRIQAFLDREGHSVAYAELEHDDDAGDEDGEDEADDEADDGANAPEDTGDELNNREPPTEAPPRARRRRWTE